MKVVLGRKRGEHAGRPHTVAVVALASRTVRLGKNISFATTRGIAKSVSCGEVRRRSKQNQPIASFCRDETIHALRGCWRLIKNNEFSRGPCKLKSFSRQARRVPRLDRPAKRRHSDWVRGSRAWRFIFLSRVLGSVRVIHPMRFNGVRCFRHCYYSIPSAWPLP